MALSTSDVIGIYENAPDSAAIVFRAPTLSVNMSATETNEYYATLTCGDSLGNTIGSQSFLLTESELVAQDEDFAATYAAVKYAFQKAVKARLEAIPVNSGKTINFEI